MYLMLNVDNKFRIYVFFHFCVIFLCSSYASSLIIYVMGTRHLICFAFSTRRLHLSRSLTDLSHVSRLTSALLRSFLTTSILTSVFRFHVYRNLQHTTAFVSAISVQLCSAYFIYTDAHPGTINDSDYDSRYQE